MALVVVALSGCMVNESNRAAPNLLKVCEHRAQIAAMPAAEAEALTPLRDAEDAAVHEYYQAIASGDAARFAAAKKSLADAVAQAAKAMGEKP